MAEESAKPPPSAGRMAGSREVSVRSVSYYYSFSGDAPGRNTRVHHGGSVVGRLAL
jgi:hypothetical protein